MYLSTGASRAIASCQLSARNEFTPASHTSTPFTAHTKAATPSERLRLRSFRSVIVERRLPKKASRTSTLPWASAETETLTSDSQVIDYFATDKRPIILFDGVCNMCNGGVNFCLDWDKTGELRFAALQSEAGKALLVKSGRRPDDISSIVFVDETGSLLKSEAVIKIAELLSLPFPALSVFASFFPAFFRDFVYDTVAENRYSILGERSACRLSDPNFDNRFVS
ncbi:hypothetical protein CYMTET_48346 [Cymbomonas tetramitiformis]|uniref:DUF393 domain-containing protein n=1 Tax=Cymbomonas tetramitiformis TaxID=36881 RepID=A0AAE0EV36_9CHLO|nr:hypothetical protein CYMTET_48346 [Cymbomonas tetramitiformis]